MKNIIETTIFLVRHGETHKGREIFWSRKPGRRLNQKGKEQIEKTATYLSQFPVTQIFHSPSKRTTESAEIIQKYIPQAEILEVKNLWEWDQGFEGQKVEGKPFASFGPEINEMYQKYPTKMIGGETLPDAIKRAIDFINKLLFLSKLKPQLFSRGYSLNLDKKTEAADFSPWRTSFQYQEKFIVCVSHEDVIRGVVLAMQKENLDKLNSIPCVKGSIYKVVFRENRLISVDYILN